MFILETLSSYKFPVHVYTKTYELLLHMFYEIHDMIKYNI